MEVAKRNGAFVVSEKSRGYGNACLKGINAISDNTDIVVFLDGDYSDYPQDLEKLVSPIIVDGFDFVLGSRTMLKNKGLSTVQKFGNRLACLLMRIFYGFSFTDLGPFRAIKYDKLKDLNMKDRNFGWTVEMQIKALKNKIKIKEVPVRYRERFAGKSKVSGTIQGIFKAGFKIISLIFKYKFKN